jgi:hypothetical protein
MVCLNFRLLLRKENHKRGTIAIKVPLIRIFVSLNLPVEQGVSYDYYFEVFDNDAIHNFKSTKSSVFSNRVAQMKKIKFYNNKMTTSIV